MPFFALPPVGTFSITLSGVSSVLLSDLLTDWDGETEILVRVTGDVTTDSGSFFGLRIDETSAPVRIKVDSGAGIYGKGGNGGSSNGGPGGRGEAALYCDPGTDVIVENEGTIAGGGGGGGASQFISGQPGGGGGGGAGQAPGAGGSGFGAGQTGANGTSTTGGTGGSGGAGSSSRGGDGGDRGQPGEAGYNFSGVQGGSGAGSGGAAGEWVRAFGSFAFSGGGSFIGPTEGI